MNSKTILDLILLAELRHEDEYSSECLDLEGELSSRAGLRIVQIGSREFFILPDCTYERKDDIIYLHSLKLEEQRA